MPTFVSTNTTNQRHAGIKRTTTMRKFKLEENSEQEIDSQVFVREISGRMTKRRYQILARYVRVKPMKRDDLRCHHEYDCCGCLCRQSMELQASNNGAKIFLFNSYNY